MAGLEEGRRALHPGGSARDFAAGHRDSRRRAPAAVRGGGPRRGAGDFRAAGSAEPDRSAAAPRRRSAAPRRASGLRAAAGHADRTPRGRRRAHRRAVARRRSQLALLRALGVTRRALVAMLLAEAAVVGAVGALAGIALGHATAAIVLRRFGAELGAGYFRGLEPTLALDLPALALFFSAGVLAAVLGSLAPALEAARAGAASALKAGDEERALERLRPAWPGIAVILAGAALTQAGPVGGLPFFGYGAIALLLIGTVMLMPRIAVLCFRAAPLLGPLPARIGLAQLRGAPGQTGVSLAAIVAAMSLMVSMAIMVTSFRQSLDEWLERVLPADLYLRTGAGSDTAFLSPAEQRAIAALPGVRRVEFLRSQRLFIAPDKPPITLLARAVEAEGRVPPLLGSARCSPRRGCSSARSVSAWASRSGF